ncbi:MAG: hypothetical protein JSW41_05655 [Candidatus Aenigmatarchaeota archaeon]|nr:MAG: hypothetical protein JSW41_05655 [Candidatus Aenigmarchaeota archaeon]
MATQKQKEIDALKERIGFLETILEQQKLVTNKLTEKLIEKIGLAEGQFKKFSGDMIRESKVIHRINAAMERQKVRDYNEILELMYKIIDQLSKSEEDEETKD